MGMFSMCPACGSDWCTNAECVKREYMARFLAQIRKLRERNDGKQVLIRLSELDQLADMVKSWEPK